MQENYDKIKTLTYEIENLNAILNIEKIKNNIYRQIIELNTSIKIDDIMEIKEDGLYIYDIKYGLNIPIYYTSKEKRKEKKKVKIKKHYMKHHESPYYVIDEEELENIKEKEDEDDEEEDEEKEENSSFKKKYKSAKNKVEIIEELTDEQKLEIVKNIEAKRNDEEQKILPLKFSITETIQNCLISIKNNRVYKKSLSELKRERFKLIQFTPLQEYISLLENHNNKLKTIFTDKNYSDKKIEKLISQSMYALELRLIWYKSFHNSYIEIDEIEKFFICLSISVVFPKKYEPFDRNIFFSNFHNYGSSFFSIGKCIETYLFNPYKFHNVIYLPYKEPTDDPYTFYILEKVENDKRYWRLDGRLEELCNDFRDNVRTYLIKLFRKLYNVMFSDNEYRQDYLSRGQLMESDCEQLVQSILLLSNQKEICKLFRRIVKEKAVHSATKYDKFNMYGDDPLQKKRLNNPSSKDEPDIIDIVKELFDNMKTEDAVDFYRSHSSNIV